MAFIGVQQPMVRMSQEQANLLSKLKERYEKEQEASRSTGSSLENPSGFDA